MATTSLQIQLNYSAAVRQADSLAQIANNLKQSAENDFQDSISAIEQNWKGENAQAYIAKCNKVRQDILKTAESLSKTADTIKQIANDIRDAETTALTFAESRTYRI